MNRAAWTGTKLIAAISLLWAVASAGPPVNAESQITQEFEKRVAAYENLHKDAESKLPKLKSTVSSDKIYDHRHDLADAIRKARADARQGDIFTPAICAEFRRLTALAMQGGDARRIKKSLQSSEPVKFQLKVNDSYPRGVPKQSTPSTLLINLPPLPADLEYRPLGSTLVLLDIKTNLVVDLAPAVIP